ncbi:MAG: hypothetical protein ACOYL3_04275 [Desulfuromonadaceae bacterium]
MEDFNNTKRNPMDFYEVIMTRLSVRQYTRQPVEKEMLTRINLLFKSLSDAQGES